MAKYDKGKPKTGGRQKGTPRVVAMSEPPPTDPLLTMRELVEYSRLSVSTLRRHMADPVSPLPHFKLGQRVLFRKAEFGRWLEEHRRTSPDLETVVRKTL